MTKPTMVGRSIELIYDRNVASEKLKHGTKYERIAARVFQLLDNEATVIHDIRLRGDGKKTKHQIDVDITRNGRRGRTIVECRDKTPKHKVGLDEARSFQTVISHLGAKGAMVTTTGYTKGARELAADEGIELLILRPFEEGDIEGRVTAIELHITLIVPQVEAVRVGCPPGTPEADMGNVTVAGASMIVSGSEVGTTFSDLLMTMMDTSGGASAATLTVERSFAPPIVVEDSGHQFSIAEIAVDYHVDAATVTQRVDVGDKIAELVLQSLSGDFDRVIFDEDLQKYDLDGSGTVRSRS
jgi:hypothetical protein